MNIQRNEDVNSVWLIAIEGGKSVEEHERLRRFLNRNKPNSSMVLYNFEAVVYSTDETGKRWSRRLKLPVFQTTFFEDERFLLYDEDNCVFVYKTDLIYYSRYPGGPMAISNPRDIARIASEICEPEEYEESEEVCANDEDFVKNEDAGEEEKCECETECDGECVAECDGDCSCCCGEEIEK